MCNKFSVNPRAREYASCACVAACACAPRDRISNDISTSIKGLSSARAVPPRHWVRRGGSGGPRGTAQGRRTTPVIPYLKNTKIIINTLIWYRCTGEPDRSTATIINRYVPTPYLLGVLIIISCRVCVARSRSSIHIIHITVRNATRVETFLRARPLPDSRARETD